MDFDSNIQNSTLCISVIQIIMVISIKNKNMYKNEQTFEIAECLKTSWRDFQNEPGYDISSNTLTLEQDEFHYELDPETGENLNNGEVRKVIRTFNWPNYLFGEHLDQNQMTLLKILRNRQTIDAKYSDPIFISRELNNRFQWIRESLHPSSHYWEDFLNTQRDLIQNQFKEAVPDECLEALLISYVTGLFENAFQKEFEIIRLLDIAAKKIKINLIKSEIATLFGLMLNSNIISINESLRLAKVLEAEFYTELEGKGKKKLKPMNLTSMDNALVKVVGRLVKRDTTILNTRDKLLKMLKAF